MFELHRDEESQGARVQPRDGSVALQAADALNLLTSINTADSQFDFQNHRSFIIPILLTAEQVQHAWAAVREAQFVKHMVKVFIVNMKAFSGAKAPLLFLFLCCSCVSRAAVLP